METLVDLLEESARRFQHRDAFLFKPGLRTQRWSYGQVWEQSGKVASLLSQRGITKGDRIVLWAPNRPEWAFTLFGCFRLGAVAVPLDVRSSPDFVQDVIAQTEPKLVFLSRFLPSSDAVGGMPSVYLEELHQTVLDSPVEACPHTLSGNDLAEIIFTSGTTGNSKGVMLSHRNIVSNVQMSQHIMPTDIPHRLLSLLPLSHMLEQIGGLFGVLHAGSAVVYPVSRQPSILLKTMSERKVTTMIVVPQVLQMFMNSIEREVVRAGKEQAWGRLQRVAAHLPMWGRRQLFRSVHARFGGELRYVGCGGAYLDPLLGEKWERLGVTVLQGYGTTETSPAITSNTFRQHRLDSLGKALPGQEIRIAPDGEIHARGPNVMQGYWRNPQATAEVVEDGWYKTGDLGHLDEQGFLFFKGRKKDLIVLANGQNVYPEDIENLLRKQPGVKDTTVVGLPKEGGAVEVHAVLLLEDGAQAQELVRSSNGQSAAHQQIQGFTIWPLEDFPRTHTLKVKKREVLEFIQQQKDERPVTAQAAEEPPSDAVLLRLVSGLSSVPAGEVLPESTLGGDLSLDSLGRVELLSAIEEELGVYLDDAALSPKTTYAQLERLVAETPQGRSGLAFSAWPLHPVMCLVRQVFQQLVLFPLYHLLWQVRVTGREGLKGIAQPVLVAPNHNFAAGTFGLDPPAAWLSLPRELRRGSARPARPTTCSAIPSWAFLLGVSAMPSRWLEKEISGPAWNMSDGCWTMGGLS